MGTQHRKPPEDSVEVNRGDGLALVLNSEDLLSNQLTFCGEYAFLIAT